MRRTVVAVGQRGALTGLALTGRRATAGNASVEGASRLTSAHGIDIVATNTSHLASTIVAAALAGGLGAFAGAVTVSRNTLNVSRRF